MRASVEKYSRTQIIVHWATLLTMIGSFATHFAMEEAWVLVRRGQLDATPDLAVRAHVVLGVLVLVLTLLRFALRFRHGAPAPVEGQHPLITTAAAVVHGLLYLIILALPLTGIAAWLGGVTVSAEVHGVLFGLFLLLLAAHVAAALFHQFVIKDNLLARMR